MVAQTTRDKLHKLHELLLQERKWAKDLAVDKMIAVSKEKQQLIQQLEPAEEMNSEDLSMTEAIWADNRRNAYLFWATLTWIRESMEFMGKQTSPCAYNAGGDSVAGSHNGRLLSGKV